MKTEQARSFVRETFQQKFDKSRFRVFTINLLNHVDESQARKWEQTSIKDAFKNHVRTYERLGTYTSPEKDKLDVLIVYLTTNTKLRHARTAIRNFVAEHLKTHGNKEAALVAFVSRSEKQWRFSHIKMEHSAVKKQGGQIGVETRLSPARRSSYLVGESESCHTAQSQFLDLLQDTENRPTLAQVEDAFSVEAVTKEFFKQYKTLFLGFKDELDSLVKKDRTIGAEFAAKHISTADFAKKLMGQGRARARCLNPRPHTHHKENTMHPHRSHWITALAAVFAVALAEAPVFAQGVSPWLNAVDVLQQAFTGPLARGLSLIAIVIGGLMFAFGEGGSKKALAGIIFGLGMAMGAANFLTWLFS